MITTQNLTKEFEGYAALADFSLSIRGGAIYGLVGTNGAGKSTLLRTLAGIYRPTAGEALCDGAPVFENVKVKSQIFLVADDLYFLPGSTLQEMARFYAAIYPGWSWQSYERFSSMFPIPPRKKLSTFSKGMKRQAAIILALAVAPTYLFLDEAFDGLDPVIRVAVRKLIADEVASRGMTVVISSHNLRELEDFCDHVAILHRGKLLIEKELDSLKMGFSKIQIAFAPGEVPGEMPDIEILHSEQSGSVLSMIVRGSQSEVLPKLERLNPVVLDCVPLTLEEVFIHEMEVVGYDYNNILF